MPSFTVSVGKAKFNCLSSQKFLSITKLVNTSTFKIIVKGFGGRLKRLFFITGAPGIGKTTVLLKTVEALKNMGFRVGGMLSREVRERGTRVGFEIVDFETEERGWLAHVNQPDGPQVSKYRVNLRDLETLGAASIRNAVAKAQIVIIDEIGPMELFSPAFKEAAIQAINSDKPVLGVIHHRARDPLIDSIRTRDDAEIIEVTYTNRGHINNLLIKKIIEIQSYL
jgi:nucleoside-triphosphatase